MTCSPARLALLLVTLSAAFVRAEEPWSSKQESKSHTKAREDKKKTTHAPAEAKAGHDSASRFKALEAENLRLRQELARKSGVATMAGGEAGSPEGALAELVAGNSRFVTGARTRSQMAYNDAALRATLAKGQAPFAVIVTCSDSRLADNFIFDQELGRLFTVREAGNCPDIQGLASIEYAVEHLGSKVVVVLGHESCGAVKAVKESGPKPLPGNLWSLQAAMSGLLEAVHPKPGGSPAEHLSQLVETNALRQAQTVLARSPLVAHLCQEKKLSVVPAVYDLASGKVRFLPAVTADAPTAEAHH